MSLRNPSREDADKFTVSEQDLELQLKGFDVDERIVWMAAKEHFMKHVQDIYSFWAGVRETEWVCLCSNSAGYPSHAAQHWFGTKDKPRSSQHAQLLSAIPLFHPKSPLSFWWLRISNGSDVSRANVTQVSNAELLKLIKANCRQRVMPATYVVTATQFMYEDRSELDPDLRNRDPCNPEMCTACTVQALDEPLEHTYLQMTSTMPDNRIQNVLQKWRQQFAQHSDAPFDPFDSPVDSGTRVRCSRDFLESQRERILTSNLYGYPFPESVVLRRNPAEMMEAGRDFQRNQIRKLEAFLGSTQNAESGSVNCVLVRRRCHLLLEHVTPRDLFIPWGTYTVDWLVSFFNPKPTVWPPSHNLPAHTEWTMFINPLHFPRAEHDLFPQWPDLPLGVCFSVEICDRYGTVVAFSRFTTDWGNNYEWLAKESCGWTRLSELPDGVRPPSITLAESVVGFIRITIRKEGENWFSGLRIGGMRLVRTQPE